jgi:LmbE family N-acetylglucosaminyl deacetylase
MKKLFHFGACALLSVSLNVSAAAFIVAHPDDIELFMNRNVAGDLAAGAHSVFIVTTAGDAGNGNKGLNLHGVPYYRARLNGHEAALRFLQGSNGNALEKTRYSTEVIGQYAIEKASFGNVVIYNLNLPDGNMDGSGFSGTGNQSLRRLLDGRIATIASVDGKNTYTLSGLKTVVQNLISINHKASPAVWVNIQDHDAQLNPGDHVDHMSTGELVSSALHQRPYSCINMAHFQDYSIAGLPENMSVEEKNLHVGTWGALNAGLINSGNYPTWEPGHNSWLGRQYYRVEYGSGSCNF